MNDGYLSSALGVSVPVWAEAAAIGALGLVLGSFVSALSWRLPRGEDWKRKRSACPACGATLSARDLLPLLSFFLQKGRCRHCRAPISPRYPLIETACAALMLATYLLAGDAMYFLWLGALSVLLIAMIVTDVEQGILPDGLQGAAGGMGIAYHIFAVGHIHAAIWGALVGAGLGWALRRGYFFLKKEHGLGWGDVKFFAVAGAWAGPGSLPFFFFLSGLCGVVFGLAWRGLARRGGVWAGGRFPFGPALALALWMTLMVQAVSPGEVLGIFYVR